MMYFNWSFLLRLYYEKLIGGLTPLYRLINNKQVSTITSELSINLNLLA